MRGLVHLKGCGRPAIVYGKKCKQEDLEHEVMVTEAELLLGKFQRRAKVGKAIPDGLLIRNGKRFFIEVDNHTMTTKQMEEKWKNYGQFEGYILVICHTKRRLKRLMRSAESVKNVALFTRFRWLHSTVKEPWIDCWMHRTGI